MTTTAPKSGAFRVSLSAYQAFQQCEQRYDYGYIKRLRQKVKDTAPQRGILIHEYLGAYYQALRDGKRPAFAHGDGMAVLLAAEKEISGLANVAFYAGREDVAAEYQELLPSVTNIAERYFTTWGERDAERYEVLLVEHRLAAILTAGVISDSVIDLVLRERDRGIVWLVEHKSTGSVPDQGVRIRDFQTLLYSDILGRNLGIEVDGLLWNYIRTKVPTVPRLLKTGGFSRAKDIDTTWEVYEKTVRDAGYDPEEYADVRERLKDKETTVFFPRFEHVQVAKSEILLEDYALTAQRMRRLKGEWAQGVGKPTRALSRNCSFCPYLKICEAAITGGDEQDVIDLYFLAPKGGGHYDASGDSAKGDADSSGGVVQTGSPGAESARGLHLRERWER